MDRFEKIQDIIGAVLFGSIGITALVAATFFGARHASIEEIQAQIDSANAIISQIVEGGIDEGEIEKYLEYRARLISMQKELGKANRDLRFRGFVFGFARFRFSDYR